jgi:phosphoribosyl 1,2-cyclic phosphodiesterase
MRITVLGSGSSGNAILVESQCTRLLIDAGFSGRDLERRLATVDVAPESIDGLLITHDHSDHTMGMGILARRWGIPLYLTDLTRAACARLLKGTETVRRYHSSEPVVLGDLVVNPFLTLHDAVDPVAVTVTETRTGQKMGIATDLGRPTAAVRHSLRHCDLLILESNHDEILLRESPYPWSVKSRIASSHGHLSNRAAAELVTDLAHPGLAGVVLAHLSGNANDPRIAEDTVGQALERLHFGGELLVGKQHEPLLPIDLSTIRKRIEPEQLPLL